MFCLENVELHKIVFMNEVVNNKLSTDKEKVYFFFLCLFNLLLFFLLCVAIFFLFFFLPLGINQVFLRI